jgi:hypothetical protein
MFTRTFSVGRSRALRLAVSLVLALGLVLGMMALVGCPMGDDDDDKTDPYADYIQISNQNDLAKIGSDDSYPLNGNYSLAADINLTEWAPIGSGTEPFAGILYGNKKTITLTSFSAGASSAKHLGIFAYADGATISDLAIELGTISITSAADSTIYVGAIAGYVKDTKLSNIKVSSGSLTFSANAVVNAGGLIGCGLDSEITDSSVSSPIAVTANGNSGVGGIAGSIKSSVALKAKVRNSSSTGTVSLTWENGGVTDYGMLYVGGIAGDSAYSEYGGTQYYGGLFENCYSTGAVACASVGYPYGGGIVGFLYASARINACYAAGAITATATGTGYAGGIAGNNSSASTIENSYATGNVTLAGPGNIGGIVGQNGSNGSIVQYCYATGTVVSNTTTANVGGIAGQNYNAENNDIKANAALNAKIDVAASTTYAHRVVGVHGSIAYGETELKNDLAKITNNIANVTDTTNMAIGEKSVNSVEGADSVAKPAWTDYAALGWSATKWKATLGSNGYPVLAWE